MQALYTAVATSTGDGRNGHVATDDGLIDTDVRMPAGLGGPGGATNPEQLFAAGRIWTSMVRMRRRYGRR